MTLIKNHGGYLYQHAPHLFPYDFLSDAELHVWALFYNEQNRGD